MSKIPANIIYADMSAETLGQNYLITVRRWPDYYIVTNIGQNSARLDID